MSSWRKQFGQKAWDEIDWLNFPHTVQKAFFDALCASVPKVWDENGVERVERHILPSKICDTSEFVKWKGAAEILMLGELQAAVEGEPPNDLETWKAIRSRHKGLLKKYAASGEGDNGAKLLSRQRHAKDALEHLHQIGIMNVWMRGELDGDDEKRWLDEIIAGVAWNAFLAGRHAQTAINKPIERDAVRGEKVAGGARNSAHATNLRHINLRKRRLARMEELVPDLGVENAARQCEFEKLGGFEAIKRQWNRHKNRDS